MIDIIRELHWTKFTTHLEAAIEPLVMEFYVNAFEGREGKIRIRGIEVSFDAAMINRYYNLPNIPLDRDEYVYLTKELDYGLIIRTLTDGQGEWKITNGVHKGFLAKFLKFEH